MSNLPEEKKSVYSFLQKSLQGQREQSNVLQTMLDQMLEIESNVLQTAAEVKVLAKEIRDENRLLPAEIDDMYMAVVAKSISLAKVRNNESDDGFTKIVGKYRRMIWSKMKKHFGASKYIHTKRINFKAVLEFIESFNPEDYL